MGKLLRKAELLSQNPSIGSILGMLNEITKELDRLSDFTDKLEQENANMIEEHIKMQDRIASEISSRKKSKKNV